MKILKQRESLHLTVLKSVGFGGASSEIKRPSQYSVGLIG